MSLYEEVKNMLNKQILRLHFFLIFTMSLISCSLSDQDKVDKAEIASILNRIRVDFNDGNESGIMSHYHLDFLHRGNVFNDQTFVWRERLSRYQNIEIEIVDIEIDGDMGMARLLVRYSDRFQTHPPIVEPEQFGDMSFFWHDHRSWKIYGNQEPN
jgi:hypothetical protein